MKADKHYQVDALDALKTQLQIIDGWRETYPTTMKYTCYQKGGRPTQSRIDRIYIKPRLFDSAYEWDIQTVGIPTDHRMVSVKVATEDAPVIGPGRWVWPTHILKDKKLTAYIHEQGTIVEAEINRLLRTGERSDEANIQTVWATFKDRVNEFARERAKIVIPRLTKEIQTMEAKLDAVTNDESITEEERILAAAIVTEKLASLEMKRHKSTRANVQARNRLEGEVISRYWSRLNKSKAPREVFKRLKKPHGTEADGERQYEKDPQRMADIAGNYHNNIQYIRKHISPEIRENHTKDVLGRIRAKVSAEQKLALREQITRLDVQESLRLSANYKAPGLDGIPYEVWKTLNSRFETDARNEKPTFDVLTVLQRVYNDIESHGMTAGTGFSQSWMCPLYKKNDRSDIANYRPISLLNTDYKIFTKALTIKLAKIAPDLIHPSQAGFVPGRHIYDQIWLSKLIINLAEATDQDGVIIALDQEKAYDKIEHDYLWETLTAFGIPDEFVNTIKALYSDAHTIVMINGIASKPFKVIRGVRQGDPLSCLLFDLAIEPLAESLRQSNLEGFKIPGKEERLIATLFADDTTTYLSKNDDFGVLVDLLDVWCAASGAKFNITKTEIIPIGTLEHRNAVQQNRYINGTDGTKIPENIKISKDREPIRSLGAMIGNNICQIESWARVLEKIDASLKRWEQGHPTMEGRRLIIQMVVGGMTQYLTKVQGMPKGIEEKLEKRIRKFLWAEKTSVTVNKETTYAPVTMGGRNLLDLPVRNEAIMVTWIKSYLNFGLNRPTWAYVADVLISQNAHQGDHNVSVELRDNIFLQSWDTTTNRLPDDLGKLVKTARKYDVRLEGLAFSREILREMPIWYHVKSLATRTLFNRGCSVCLKENHGIRTVGEMETLARKLQSNRHTQRRNCKCAACKETRQRFKCLEPNKCYNRAQKIMDSLPQKWNPQSRQPEDYEAPPDHETLLDDVEDRIFDMRVTETGTLADAFRIFTNGEPTEVTPDMEPRPQDELDLIKLYTDGSSIGNGTADASAGAGIYVAPDDPRNRSIRVPDELSPSNQVGEVIAVKEAVETFPKSSPMLIVSDSRYVIDGLTKSIRKWEDEGWFTVKNAEVMRATVSQFRARKAPTTLRWIKGHSGDQGNDGADEQAGNGCWKDESDLIDMTIEPRLLITGAKLQAMTQSLAYRIIRGLKMEEPKYQNALDRYATGKNVTTALKAAGEHREVPPLQDQLWNSIRSKDIPRNIRFFLWMMIHDGYKIGNYWKNIAGYAERGTCSECGVVETMEHILITCKARGQAEVWKIASELWQKKTGQNLHPSFGEIMACGLVTVGETADKPDKGKTRLFRILVTESTHLIWKIRNDRVINEKDPASEREIRHRWVYTMNNRLEMDCLLSDAKYGSKAISKALVMKTWRKVLHNEDNLPKDWTRGAGVLVGIGG